MKNHLEAIKHYQSIIWQWLYFMKLGYQTSYYPNMIASILPSDWDLIKLELPCRENKKISEIYKKSLILFP